MPDMGMALLGPWNIGAMPPATGQFDHLLKGDEIGRFLGQFVLPEHIRTDIESRNPGAALPKTPEDVLRDIKGIWGRKGFLTPAELRTELIDKYLPDSPAALKGFIRDVELSRNKPESVTGYLNKEHAYAATALSHLYANEMRQPIAMVEVDFSNMGGTNDKFRAMLAKERGVPLQSVPKSEAEALTDKAVKLLSDSMATDLQRHLPPGAKVIPVRTGGDEVRLIFTGVDDPKELNRLKDIIHAGIEKHVAGMGLQDHPHLKDPKNPVRNGFGAAVAIQDMRKIEDPKSLIQILDEDISSEKKKIGEQRLGIVNERLERAILEREIDQGQRKIPEGSNREALISSELDKIKAKALAASQVLHQQNPERNPTLKGGIDGFNQYVARSSRDMEPSPLVTRAAPAVIAGRPPVGTDRPQGVPVMAGIEQRQTAQAEHHFSRQGVQLNSAERFFMGQSISGLTAIDPSARVMMPKEMAALTEVYAAEAEEIQRRYASNPEGQSALKQAGLGSVKEIRPQALAVSFHGLASFNSVMGHENADYALRHMGADLIEKSLHQAGIKPLPDGSKPYAIAHHGGGNFSVIVQPVVPGADGKPVLISPDIMKKVDQHIGQRLQEFGKTTVAAFLESQGVPVNDNLRNNLDRKGVTTFDTMPDSKVRVVKLPDAEMHGQISGIHKVSASSHIQADTDMKGSNFLGALRNRADTRMDQLREQHVVKTGEMKPVSVPDTANTGPVSAVAAVPSATGQRPAAEAFRPDSATPAAVPRDTLAEIKAAAKAVDGSHIVGNGVGLSMGLYGLTQKLGENGSAAADLKDEKTRTLAKAGIVSDVAAITVDGVDTFAKVSRNLQTAAKVSRVVAPVGVALTVASGAVDYKIAAAKGDGKRAAEAVGGSAGGMAGAMAGGVAGAKAGALAGAAVGVWFGGVGAVPAAAIGSAIGGIAGALGGGWFGAEAGKKVAEVTIQDKLQKKFDAEKAEALAAANKPATAAAKLAVASSANDPSYKSPSASVTKQASETFAASAPKAAEHFKVASEGKVAAARPDSANEATYRPAAIAANNKTQSGMRV